MTEFANVPEQLAPPQFDYETATLDPERMAEFLQRLLPPAFIQFIGEEAAIGRYGLETRYSGELSGLVRLEIEPVGNKFGRLIAALTVAARMIARDNFVDIQETVAGGKAVVWLHWYPEAKDA